MKKLLLLGFVMATLAGGVLNGQEPQLRPTGTETETVEQAPEAATTSVTETARQTGEAVVAAAEEAVSTASEGGAAAVGQTESIWSEVMVVMWQRFAEGIPVLTKALLLLLLFWLAGMFLGTVTRRLLDLTRIDERAARDWGFGDFLDGEKPRRSISGFAATVVKWMIFLLGFVAFFQTLELNMVAGPLQNVVDNVGGAIPGLLQAAVILLVYWAVASLVRAGTKRGLGTINFDERVTRRLGSERPEGEPGPSSQIARLLFYVVLLFGLPPLLEALGQESLLEPLGGMLGEGLAFIPNLVAAAILFFIGRVLAAVVREVVGNLLQAAGADRLGEKAGLSQLTDERSVSQILATIAYLFVLVPILVAAIDALGVTAISDPVKAMLTQLLSAIPLILVAAFLGVLGYFVAKTVGELVSSFLTGVGADSLPERIGLGFLEPKEGQRSISEMAGLFVTFVILLFTAQQIFATLELDALAGLVGNLVGYLPELLSAVAIFVIGLSVAGWLAEWIRGALSGHPQVRFFAALGRAAVIFVAFSIGLTQLGLGEEIVASAAAATFGGLALALGIGLGLGSKDKAKELVERVVR